MKKYLMSIFTFILMFTFVSSVSAKENVEISNVSISDKTSTMVAKVDSFNGLTLNTKESFYEVGDFVTYNITIKNTTGKSLSVSKISDNLNNEYVSSEYNYDKKEIKNNEEYSFNVTLKYKKEITDNSMNFNVPLNIVIEYTDGSSTGILVNPDTKDNVLIYFIIFVLSAISLVLFKTKKNKLLVFVVALGLIPSIVYAVSNKIAITMNNEIGIYKRLAIMDTGANVNKKIKELAGTDTSADENASNIFENVVDSNIKHIVRARELPSNIALTDSNKISSSNALIPIYAWFDNGTLYYYTESDTIYLNEDSERLFASLSKVEDIDMSIFDTSNVTNISYMFYGCESIKNTDVSKFNTSNVSNMKGTFGGMLQLEDISALENWDVSNVTTMYSFLFDCRNLIDFTPLSKWDTSNVTSMGFMFGLTSEANGGRKKDNAIIDLSPLKDWNTSKVTTMSGMFQNYNIKSFEPFEKWDVSKVKNFSNMFNQTEYSQVKTLHGLEKWDVSSAKNMSTMFSNGAKLEDASAINDWDVRNVTNFENMFKTNHIIHPEFTKVSGTWENGTFIKNS